MPLLKTHPVNVKHNLEKIAGALDLHLIQKATRGQIQAEIDDYLKKEPDLFEKVREIAMEMITEYRQSKDNENNPNLAKSPTITHDLPTAKPQHPPPPEIHISQSQSLFDDTGVIECDPESDLKQKIFETDGEDEDSQTKRP